MFKLATKVNPKLTIAARLETHYYDTLLKDLVILNYKHSPELKQPLLDVDVRDIFTKPLKDIPTSKSTVSNLLSLPVTAKRTRKWTSLIYNPIDYTNVTKERMIEFEKKSVPIESIKLVDSIPRIQKISLRIWNETAIGNKNMVFSAIMALSAISGVRAEPLFAAKGDANKKIRQGMPLGGKVDLTGREMYLFLDKLKETVLPRLREWHGFSPTSTRKPGTISLKLSEAALGYFPDIEAHFDMFPRLFDTDIDIITTATTDSEAVMMLSGFGLPFTERETVKRVKSDDDDPWAKFRRKSDKKRTSTNQKVAKK